MHYYCIFIHLMSKKNRHRTIREILKQEDIVNQDILLTMLLDRGFEITQATLSRDMKELKVVKAPTASGQYTYQLSEDVKPQELHGMTNLVASGFVNIEFSGQLAVIKTRPGYAMAIASEIDHKATEYVLGTVAGDDTILVIPREDKTREEVVDSLSTFIPNLK